MAPCPTCRYPIELNASTPSRCSECGDGLSLYDVRADLDLDGDVDGADEAIMAGNDDDALGRGKLSALDVGMPIGWGQLEWVKSLGLYERASVFIQPAIDLTINAEICWSEVTEEASDDEAEMLDLNVEMVGMMATDSITQYIRTCMQMKTFCLRYQCLEPIYDSFDTLCGGCLSDYVKHLRTLIQLWCNKGDPSKVTGAFCTAQYAIMKPFCDTCRTCQGPAKKKPTDAECSAWQKTIACLGVCKGWYQWFDAACAKAKNGSGKHDPNRHAEKIKNFQTTLDKCANKIKGCTP